MRTSAQFWAMKRAAWAGRLRCACLFVALNCSSSLWADSRVTLQAGSDWIYHGTTETFSQGTLGLNVEWQSAGPWFAGVEAHQAITPGTQQRHGAMMGYAGVALGFGQDWNVSASFARRAFPGSFKNWDYNELKLEVAHRDGAWLKVDYAADYYDHATEALVSEAGFSGALSERRYWYASAGRALLSAERFGHYSFAQIGTGFSQGRTNIDLSYGWNSRNGQPFFGSERIRSPGLVLSLSYRLR